MTAVVADSAVAQERIAALVDGVAIDGYAIVPHFVDEDTGTALRERARAAFAQQRMQPARVGRATSSMRDTTVRGDAILWLDETNADANERALLASLESLRLAVNSRLWLGLFDFEGHYACYPPGAFYARHRDRFRDQDTRTLSFILYLNDDWADAAGGALRLYRDDGAALDVMPRGSTVVTFLADRFPHEVLPATRPRWSFTGWFRRRPW